jgi:hypothetical protein
MLKENLEKVCKIIAIHSEDEWNQKALPIEESLKNCIKLKLCTASEAKKIEKLIMKIKTDLNNAGINASIRQSAYSIINKGKEPNVGTCEIQKDINTKLSERKSSIDQRPLLSRKIDNEERMLSYTKTKKDAGIIQKKIKDMEKEREKLMKSNTYFQTSNDFRTMISNVLSDVKLKKLPNYINFERQSVYMESQDSFEHDHGGYSLSIKKLNKEKLKETLTKIKEKKYMDGFLEKYNNEMYIVDVIEHESMPKEFQLVSYTSLKIQLDKIPEYKSLIGLNKKLETTNDMEM